MANFGFGQQQNFPESGNIGGSHRFDNPTVEVRAPPNDFRLNQQFPPIGPFTPNVRTPNDNGRRFVDINNNQVDFNNNLIIPQGGPGNPPPPPMSPALQTPLSINASSGSSFGGSYGNGAPAQVQLMNRGNANVGYDGRFARVQTPGQVRSVYAENPANRSEYAFENGNIVATIEASSGGATRILIGDGPARTLQARADALNSEYFFGNTQNRT